MLGEGETFYILFTFDKLVVCTFYYYYYYY